MQVVKGKPELGKGCISLNNRVLLKISFTLVQKSELFPYQGVTFGRSIKKRDAPSPISWIARRDATERDFGRKSTDGGHQKKEKFELQHLTLN